MKEAGVSAQDAAGKLHMPSLRDILTSFLLMFFPPVILLTLLFFSCQEQIIDDKVIRENVYFA